MGRQAKVSNPKPSTYIFPNFMASVMAKTSTKVQYESSLLGTTLLLISLVATTIFYVFFIDMSALGKGFIVFNAIAGFLLLSSMLVTTYQQYDQYMQALQLVKLTTGEDLEHIPMDAMKTKKIRYISAVVETLIILCLSWVFHFWYICIFLIHPIYLALTTNKYIKHKSKVK